jgi:hypothetical protein
VLCKFECWVGRQFRKLRRNYFVSPIWIPKQHSLDGAALWILCVPKSQSDSSRASGCPPQENLLLEALKMHFLSIFTIFRNIAQHTIWRGVAPLFKLWGFTSSPLCMKSWRSISDVHHYQLCISVTSSDKLNWQFTLYHGVCVLQRF